MAAARAIQSFSIKQSRGGPLGFSPGQGIDSLQLISDCYATNPSSGSLRRCLESESYNVAVAEREPQGSERSWKWRMWAAEIGRTPDQEAALGALVMASQRLKQAYKGEGRKPPRWVRVFEPKLVQHAFLSRFRRSPPEDLDLAAETPRYSDPFDVDAARNGLAAELSFYWRLLVLRAVVEHQDALDRESAGRTRRVRNLYKADLLLLGGPAGRLERMRRKAMGDLGVAAQRMSSSDRGVQAGMWTDKAVFPVSKLEFPELF